MRLINNTPFEEIAGTLDYIEDIVVNGKAFALYQHPDNPDLVVSIWIPPSRTLFQIDIQTKKDLYANRQ